MLLPYLANELHEGLRRSTPLNPKTQDLRADIIAWRPFNDLRGGQLVLFVQCAIGQNWTAKLTELNVDLWKHYLEFVASPLRAFAFPYIEPNNSKWLEYGTLGGIAFDRLRLIEVLSEVAMERTLKSQIVNWTKQQIKKLPWDE